jgi:hypothetical protein
VIKLRSSLFGILACFLGGCASPQISTRPIAASDPGALALLRAAKEAAGLDSFSKIHDISVRYEGRWALIGPRLQPVLSDTKFRRRSEERLLTNPRIIAQENVGPAGTKFVRREAREVTVLYNGRLARDEEVRRAAALVADAYTMFLLGPFYFDRPGVRVAPCGEGLVDKKQCDEILASLRPGFGYADEDRVVLFVDRANKHLVRVRMTLNGLDSTQGAEVDVTFSKFVKVGGVTWPTDFDERIRVPIRLHAHHWHMLGLALNRGFAADSIFPPHFTGQASGATPLFPSARD